MDIHIGEVKSSTENNGSFFLKRSCVDVTLFNNSEEYKIKISHESKAFSDFFFHRDSSLINTSFIFYFKNKSGVWYNFATLESMIQFIGITIKPDIFSSTIAQVQQESIIIEGDV